MNRFRSKTRWLNESVSFSDFFTKGYKAYIFFPEILKQRNRELYDYIERLGDHGKGNGIFRDTA